MSVMTSDGDSNDSDICFIKQVKPINKLTIQEALLIKHRVLNSLQNKNLKKKKKQRLNKNNYAVFKKSSKSPSVPNRKIFKKEMSDHPEMEKVEENIKKIEINEEESCSKYHNHKRNGKILPGTSHETFTDAGQSTSKRDSELQLKMSIKENERAVITNFTKKRSYNDDLKVTPEKVKFSEIRIANGSVKEISPGINCKRRKFYRFGNVSPKIKSRRKIFDENAEKSNAGENFSLLSRESFSSVLGNYINSPKKVSPRKKSYSWNQSIFDAVQKINEEERNGNSEHLCFLFKKIIYEETQKQIDLEVKTFEEGKVVEKLLSEKEVEILEKFFNLKKTACELYVRMLCRKKSWHRISTINYKDISKDLKMEFDLLQKENFVDLNIKEDLKTQMELLNKSEVQFLCKSFNVAMNNVTKKNDLIDLLIDNCTKQRSMMEMFQKGSCMSRIDMLKKKVRNVLGLCVKLNETVTCTFDKIMLLFSFAHYNDEEGKRLSNQFRMLMNVSQNSVSFPQYRLSNTVVFETFSDFELYRNALMLKDLFETAINSKRHEQFVCIASKAKEEFIILLKDREYRERFIRLESFLKKFSAGTVYARLLTKYCNTFKRKNNIREIIAIIEMLLDQDLFLSSKRGKWYEILVQALETIKENSKAAEVLIMSLKDPLVDEVQKLALQLKGQMILKKKTNALKSKYLREQLDDMCIMTVLEPQSIEISAQAVEGNASGYKAVYVTESEKGKMYSSVEERAILHYKSHGFSNGYHVEGFIVHSVCWLLFFDIIYGPSPPGVFQSSYQEVPLDFYSKSFYLNRRDIIDTRFTEMLTWTEEDIEVKLNDVYYENFNVSCIISWKEHFTPAMFCDLIKCITMPILVLICKRLISNFRVMRSGFPDLTLWNPQTKKCKFVEVKGPNDKLSPAQRAWLDYLKKIGVDCEICNVKNASERRISR